MARFSEQVKAAKDYTSEIVKVPEWGVTVSLRSASAQFRHDMGSKEIGGDYQEIDFAIDFIVESAFDVETGEKAFDDSDKEMLKGKDSLVIERLSKAALRVNGLGLEGEAEAKNGSPAAGESTSLSPNDSG